MRAIQVYIETANVPGHPGYTFTSDGRLFRHGMWRLNQERNRKTAKEYIQNKIIDVAKTKIFNGIKQSMKLRMN